MPKHLLSIDDLTDTEIDRILARASGFEAGAEPIDRARRVVGLLFGQTSLRTRVGFASAANRLDWNTIDIFERRHDPTSIVESWADTLRTLSGYLDVLVGRPGENLDRDLLTENLTIPYVNGGSVGPDAEHPSQALIDLYSIEADAGPIADLGIAICGDLRMRAAHSLLRLLRRRRPRDVALITVPTLNDPSALSGPLRDIGRYRDPWDLKGIDVLYVVGIPHQAIPESVRDTLRVTTGTMERLPDEAVVLSPLPVVDEIDADARLDARIRMYQQSDRGLYVRMAVLEHVAFCKPRG